MSRSLSPLRQALGFLTVVGGPVPPGPRALRWFPVVGAALGLVLGVAWWAAATAWPPLLAAALVVAADLVLTGGLHVDGLADAADGLLPPMERERRLAVMRAPGVGAFGVAAVAAVLVVRAAALAGLAPGLRTAALLAALWAVSRTAMAVTLVTVPYARTQGLASPFAGADGRPPLVAGSAIGVAGAVTAAGLPGLVALAAAAGAAAGVVAAARRRVGGFTGDVLGAAGMVAETAGVVAAAARW